MTASQSKPVFFKDTTDYRYDNVLADGRLLAEAHHAFLIRRPEEIAASYFALKPDMAIDDVGLGTWTSCTGRSPPPTHPGDRFRRPGPDRRRRCGPNCAEVDLPFREQMLRWERGARQEWRRSERWHRAVSDSEGFVTRESAYRESVATNATLAAYAEHHAPFYARLHALRLTLDADGA